MLRTDDLLEPGSYEQNSEWRRMLGDAFIRERSPSREEMAESFLIAFRSADPTSIDNLSQVAATVMCEMLELPKQRWTDRITQPQKRIRG